jgi:hypothetical protein
LSDRLLVNSFQSERATIRGCPIPRPFAVLPAVPNTNRGPNRQLVSYQSSTGVADPQGMKRVFLINTFSRPYTGLDFARIPYPALRAGLLSGVPSGRSPLDWWVLTQTLKPHVFSIIYGTTKVVP